MRKSIRKAESSDTCWRRQGVNSVSDDKIKEINDALLVRSFDEFLEKFEPVVYSYFDANNQKVIYTLKKPETIEDELLSEIHLNRQNDYLKMLMTLVEAKRAEGSINVDFKFEKLTDMISPKRSWTISDRTEKNFSIPTANMRNLRTAIRRS